MKNNICSTPRGYAAKVGTRPDLHYNSNGRFAPAKAQQKEYISQLESSNDDTRAKMSNVEEEMQKEILQLEESLREKLMYTNELETRVNAVQEEHAKAMISLQEKETALQELSNNAEKAHPIQSGDDEVSKLQQKQKQNKY